MSVYEEIEKCWLGILTCIEAEPPRSRLMGIVLSSRVRRTVKAGVS